MFRITAVTTFLVLAVVASTSFNIVEAAKKKDDRSKTCYDYSDVFNNKILSSNECTDRKLLIKIRDQFRLLHGNPETKVKCRGGFNRELQALTSTFSSSNAAKRKLQILCDDALQDASEQAVSMKGTWESLENEPHSIGMYY